MNEDLHPWAIALDTLYDQTWQRLIRGVHDRHAPARHPTLANVSPEGLPRARTVVLRSADKSSSTLEIHTSLRSPKIADLTARPVAALHVWDSGQKLQIGIDTEVEVVSGPEAADTWAQVPEHSRTAYSREVPGTPIPDPLAYDTQPDPAAFAVLRLHITALDVLHLGPHHRRTEFSRERQWVGQWLSP